MTQMIAVVGAVVLVVMVTALSPRFGVAGPLALVVLGVGLSFVPGLPVPEIEPEVILSGVLPPLLYSAAVSMPARDFRRDLRPISALSIVLVILSSLAVGLLVAWLVPGVGLATGIAVGAVVSPTDAVATSIVRHLGVPSRIVTILEGESLLNDATALVLLRAAVAATAGAVSIGAVAVQFVASVVIAVVIGVLVGLVTLRVRRALRDATASTAISFVVPFVASIPAEALGASGLVAAVAAGLVTGNGLARLLQPRDRSADEQNWRTVELLLEGGIFLFMGLQIHSLVRDVHERPLTGGEVDVQAGSGLVSAAAVAAAVAVTVIVVRAVHVTLLLLGLQTQQRFTAPRTRAEEHADGAEVVDDTPAAAAVLQPFGPRERAVIVWAGMRGAVTVAAAQTLPENTPQRATLVFIAFVVAAGTLLLQGATLPRVVRLLGVAGREEAEVETERAGLLASMQRAGLAVLDDPGLRRPGGAGYDQKLLARMRAGLVRASDTEQQQAVQDIKEQAFELRLAVIEMERHTLLRTRSSDTVSSSTVRDVLAALDAEQITLQLKGGLPARLGQAVDPSS